MAIKIALSDDDKTKSKRPDLPVSKLLLEDHLTGTGIHSQSDLDGIKPDAKTPKPATYKELRENFKKFCETESSLGKNFNTGMYIRLDTLEEKIREFRSEGKGTTHLYIGLGLRKSKITEQGHDWNCFHLIFGAATPNTEVEVDSNGQSVGKKPTQKSDLYFSTYDGIEHDYTGPKPGCPPFSCLDE